ncbi:hypothetical protein CHL78_008285 [Romboutsia weinsteinii]|uniref:DUF1835 domain-containing protein n=1 Tax=Romboutsia weinsteinii TaxID=2020949 RepID=A0A371J4K1_9FIRM|nr:hypothetical protein [Romboutsia weinsteinii]RDY27710.1 hypothetical protein CHL78_008285 [Romboutsia weinsteinii]
MKRANITNGEYFNQYFEDTYQEKGIPFNEAIMVGNSTTDIFSDNFCIKRAYELKVSVEEYYQKLHSFFELIKDLKSHEEIVLWFGTDTFCQLNLLTILSFLETQKYEGSVFTVIINDESCDIVREKTSASLIGYKELYDNTILHKKLSQFDDTIMNQAISLYFDYLSDCGKLAMIVKNNSSLSENELIKKLLLESKEYGISDLQAYALIQKYKK